MSMLQEFFVYLSDMFQEGGGALDTELVKERLQEEGYGDVTAYDVREAVNLMYDEGDVFSNEQSSALEAYTGGNVVDQSFNASGVGTVTAGGVGAGAGGNASGGSSSASYSGGGSGGATGPAPAYTAPPPPPMDPKDGYTDLDAAVEQIVYVSNITNNTTNNTTNVTTINDQDTFEDNDTIVDASVNQTILAAGDVNQDFDTVTQGDNAIAVTGAVDDSNLVTGDNDGVIADDISDTNIVDGDNAGVVADDATGAVVGDGNQTQTFIDSDNNAAGDGATAVNVSGANAGVIETGEGDAEAVVGSRVGAVGFGEGDVGAINDSAVGQAEFGEGDATVVSVDDSTISETAFQTGDGNAATVTSNDTTDNSIDNSITTDDDVVETNVVETNVVDVDNSITGGDIGIDTDTDTAAQNVDPGGDGEDMADMAGA